MAALRTQLALKNLTHSPRRFALSCGSIGFAVILMFMQAGFLNALLDSPVQVLHKIGGDLIAVSTASYALASEQRFPRNAIRKLRSHPQVESVMPVYFERYTAQLRVSEKPARYIRVIGLPSRGYEVDDAELNALLPRLAEPQSALIDRSSKRSFGLPTEDSTDLAAGDIELLGKQIHFVGRVKIGTDFANDGNLVVSEESLAYFFPFRGNGDPLSVVDLAVIRLRRGAEPKQVAEELNQLEGDSSQNQFSVFTRQDLIDREQAFWKKATPVGIIFTSGMLVGFAVGIIICYQILFTEVFDHMSEFATLKAMGYGNWFFIRLVLQQAWMLASFGFIPGIIVSWALFRLLEWGAGLPMMFTVGRVLFIFLLTVGMCSVGGWLAVRKLLDADPAKLF